MTKIGIMDTYGRVNAVEIGGNTQNLLDLKTNWTKDSVEFVDTSIKVVNNYLDKYGDMKKNIEKF